jgi:hypothetical protein
MYKAILLGNSDCVRECPGTGRILERDVTFYSPASKICDLIIEAPPI